MASDMYLNAIIAGIHHGSRHLCRHGIFPHPVARNLLIGDGPFRLPIMPSKLIGAAVHWVPWTAYLQESNGYHDPDVDLDRLRGTNQNTWAMVVMNHPEIRHGNDSPSFSTPTPNHHRNPYNPPKTKVSARQPPI